MPKFQRGAAHRFTNPGNRDEVAVPNAADAHGKPPVQRALRLPGRLEPVRALSEPSGLRELFFRERVFEVPGAPSRSEELLIIIGLVHLEDVSSQAYSAVGGPAPASIDRGGPRRRGPCAKLCMNLPDHQMVPKSVLKNAFSAPVGGS